MTLSERLVEYVSACFTGLWVQSTEHEDALHEIARMCHDQDWKLAVWDVAQGLQIPGSDQPSDAGGSDPLAAIRSINALATPDSSAILVLANFHRFLQSAEVVQALAHQITSGKQNRTFIVVLSPMVQIPDGRAAYCIFSPSGSVSGSGGTSSGPSGRHLLVLGAGPSVGEIVGEFDLEEFGWGPWWLPSPHPAHKVTRIPRTKPVNRRRKLMENSLY